jgi:acetyl esterase
MTSVLDPEAQAILDVIAASGAAHLSTLSVEAARERMRAALVAKAPALSLRDVRDISLPTPSGSLRVRLYRPADGYLPIALFLHGGGWTVNDVDTHDELCRRLAKRSGWLLASLDYRKAPEHKHPAPLEDAHLAYRWLLDNAAAIECDASRRAVVGESSGGALAANLSALLRDLGAPMPTYQVLAYPVTDCLDRWPSYTERGSGYILDRSLMQWYFEHGQPLGPPDQTPYFIPLATQDLSGLPATLLLTAEFDPLRDEGIAYAKRLTDAGVAVEHIHAAQQMHGFLLVGRAVASAGSLIDAIGDRLARAAR